MGVKFLTKRTCRPAQLGEQREAISLPKAEAARDNAIAVDASPEHARLNLGAFLRKVGRCADAIEFTKQHAARHVLVPFSEF